MTRRFPALILGVLLLVVALSSGGRPDTAARFLGPAPLDYAPVTVDGHQLLADDPSGSGRVVEVVGDVVGADHVAVVVPGSGQNRGNFRASGTNPGTVPLANGRALYAQMRDRAPGLRTAVVVWLGYLPPHGSGADLAGIGSARDGAEELVRFTREELPTETHVTLTCHSYGTTVCGLAAAKAGVADDVVALASPGMGVADTGQIRARVWAARAEDDWIRWVPNVRLGPVGLGDDPMTPGSGAARLSPGDISGHTQYYRPGSATLAATARIAVGECPEVQRTDPASSGDGAQRAQRAGRLADPGA